MKTRIKKWRESLLHRQEGAMAIEGMIILTLMIFILVFMLSFGFLLHQRWVVTMVANDAANRVAQSYAYPETDPVMGYVSNELKVSRSPYRYVFGKLKDRNIEKAENFARWSLGSGGMAYPVGDPEINVEVIYDDLARRHILVEIEAEYEIPFGGGLQLLGMDKTVTFHAVGRAACVDISDYIYTVNTVKAVTDINLGSKILGAVDTVLSLIDHICVYVQTPK